MTDITLSQADERLAYLRTEANRLNAVVWALESAVSLRRKAEPSTGYRSSEGLGDAPWNPADYDRRVSEAYKAAGADFERLMNRHAIVRANDALNRARAL